MNIIVDVITTMTGIMSRQPLFYLDQEGPELLLYLDPCPLRRVKHLGALFLAFLRTE